MVPMSAALRSTSPRRFALLTTIITCTMLADIPAFSQPPADLVLTGGKVTTVDPQCPTAEAIAVQGDRILAVGTQRRSPATSVRPRRY